MPASTIFIVGFMGAGKTTFGKKLAAKLKYRFIDLDAAVAQRHHLKNITGIIGEEGMDFFRELESETLKKLDLQNAVISTGGGTPCYFDNMGWMKRSGAVVFLDVDEKSIFNRLKTTNLDERPLLRGLDDDGLRKFIHEKLKERMPYYRQANLVFNPITQSLGELQQLLTTTFK